MKKNKKIICFDIDNTICFTIGKNYKKASPNKRGINKINKLYDNGYIIKLFTSRFMGRNEESALKAKKQGYKMTTQQLKNWNVKYHKLIFGKPSFDLFVDDKAMFFKKNWHKYINKYIQYSYEKRSYYKFLQRSKSDSKFIK